MNEKIASTPAGAAATELRVEGMTCGNCARRVTDALQAVPGVRSAQVSVEGRRASVRWNAGDRADIAPLLAAVHAAGYEGSRLDAASPGAVGPAGRDWHLNLWLGGVVTAVLMLGEWVFHFGMADWFHWLSFALAGVVQVLAGAPFYRGAWRQLRAGHSDMDTLVALGSSTAFGYSAWALLSGHGGHGYFMEAAAIITLISLGHWVESRVSERASSALMSLLQLAPQIARRIRPGRAVSQHIPILSKNFRDTTEAAPDGQRIEEEVPVSALNPGDLVALRPGDRVPTDGVVLEGDASVDEAMLTGESVPVDKSPRSELYTGTVNLNGRLVMRVTATGDATVLANIIAAVQRAQTSRANIQRLGDRVSSVFVPLVVLIALAAGLWWGFAPAAARSVHDALSPFLWSAPPPGGAAAGFIIAAAVLIVACPCAMGLATPAAIMAGANVAASRGILIRDGVALEKAGTITAVAFDKTGTLTLGKMEVAGFVQIQTDQGAPERIPAEGLAASLARHSTHPVSQAIAKIVTEDVSLAQWEELRGNGVQARVQPTKTKAQLSTCLARLGSLPWLRECDVSLASGEKFIAEWSSQGATIVGLALDTSLAGLFAVRDTLKPGAAAVVAQLQQRGLRTFLVTGDTALTAAGVARQAGILAENVFAEVRPDRKAALLRELQTRGERVAFVGDGINDAPALAQADLGIAVGRASDVAREAADIILLRAEIEAVPEALGLARATLRTIKQNLFWAFFYNAAAVPLAALGFMSPVLCALAMGLSDLIVIGNALRLRRGRQGNW